MKHQSTPHNDFAEADGHAQLSSLSIIYAAANKTCNKRSGNQYGSGDSTSDQSLTSLQKFFCKLAMVCDTKKAGGDTVTALACIKGHEGPRYFFASNNRTSTDLRKTKGFLSDLLSYVATNPSDFQPKAMQKQVLWRILEFNFPKLDFYLNTFARWIKECSEACNGFQDRAALSTLETLRQRANFTHDMTSTDNAHDKFLRDCEDLIKAIQAAKSSPFIKILERRASDPHADAAYRWCELRHYMGRLHSYRQASEMIVAAFTKWPHLFINFTITPIPSERFKLDKPSNMENLTSLAFPEDSLSSYKDDVAELRSFGLVQKIDEELKKNPRAAVHGEVNLHHYLLQNGLTDPSEFYEDDMFLATSKPLCRLCHYYFDSPGNDFQVQPSHMNLYPKWRLPKASKSQTDEVKEFREEVLEEMIDQMLSQTVKILTEKLPNYKRNDSRTDSHGRSSVNTSRFDGRSTRTPSKMGMIPENPYQTPPPDEDDYDEEVVRDVDSDYEQDGASLIGEAR